MRNLTGPRLAAMVGLVLGFAPIANWLTAGRELPWWSAAVMEWLVLGGAIVLLAVAVARLGGGARRGGPPGGGGMGKGRGGEKGRIRGGADYLKKKKRNMKVRSAYRQTDITCECY